MDDLEFFNSGVKQQIEIFFHTSENDKMKEELEKFISSFTENYVANKQANAEAKVA